MISGLLSRSLGGLPSNFAVMARALYRPLSQAIVHEAFKRLNVYSSSGEDGMFMTILQQFADFYEPLMLDIAHQCFKHWVAPARVVVRADQLYP